MPDDQKPDPIDDVRHGLGLLLRAAKTAIDKIPTRDFEEAVSTSAREVGRAIETVSKAIDREVFGKKAPSAPPEVVVQAPSTDAAPAATTVDAPPAATTVDTPPAATTDDAPPSPPPQKPE
jgi:hypothetical protein